MSKYLINRVDTFRVDTETEAKNFVEQLKKGDGEVIKHSIEYKEQKSKGDKCTETKECQNYLICLDSDCKDELFSLIPITSSNVSYGLPLILNKVSFGLSKANKHTFKA